MVISSKDAPGQYLFRALDAAAAGTSADLKAQSVTADQIAGGRVEAIGRQGAVVLLSTRTLDRAARDAIVRFVHEGGGLLRCSVAGCRTGNGRHDVRAGTQPIFGSTPRNGRCHWRRQICGIRCFVRSARWLRTLDRSDFNRRGVSTRRLARCPPGSATGRPAVLERAVGAGKVVLFASDLDRRWNDFPLHPGFVPFVVEAVRYVAARPAPADEFLVGRVPSGAKAIPGVQQLNGRTIAVNVDPRESSTASLTRSRVPGHDRLGTRRDHCGAASGEGRAD